MEMLFLGIFIGVVITCIVQGNSKPSKTVQLKDELSFEDEDSKSKW